jgi:hypothetical protein
LLCSHSERRIALAIGKKVERRWCRCTTASHQKSRSVIDWEEEVASMVIPEATSVCTGLRSAFEGILDWKWDGRFGTALAEFPLVKEGSVLGVLDRYLASRWDGATIGEAPEIAQSVRRYLGGLMSGQLLFLSDPGVDPLVYCAWWPWGNGQTISIRIGLFSETMNAAEKGALTKELKGWFGV